MLVTWHGRLVLSIAVLVSVPLASHETSANKHGRQERAIGGQEFKHGQWPWLGLLRGTIITRRFLGFAISHKHVYCGATLISKRWLLTAAHCFGERGKYARSPDMWEVRLGTTKLKASVGLRLIDALGQLLDMDELRQWEIDVEKVVIHPDYHDDGFQNDLALVKLSHAIPSVARIEPIRMPSSYPRFPVDGQECITKGWGCTRHEGGPSHQARQINVPVLDTAQCADYYGTSHGGQGIVCAGYLNQGIGICQGDSGGPLVCKSQGEYTLAGIVAFTAKHNPESYPGGFMRVQHYLPWINKVTSERHWWMQW